MTAISSQTSVPANPHRWLRRFAWTGSIGLLFLLGGYFFRAPLLTGLAEAWVVDEPLTHADVIVIPGGRPDLRAPEAARLYHQGYAPRILHMNIQRCPLVDMGILPSEMEVTRKVLLSNNVPEPAIVAIGKEVADTYDESCAVRAWVQENGAKSVIVVTDLANTRRVHWIFTKELKGTGAQVRVRAVQPVEYGINDWWRHEEGVSAFQSEFVKYVFYRCKY
jgi:uncharacterized SAM-binding protein YcdF (DUF218 family)